MTNELIGEVLGTALLVLLGNGVVAGVVLDKSKAKDAGWIVITIGWGLAVAMAAFVSGLLPQPSCINCNGFCRKSPMGFCSPLHSCTIYRSLYRKYLGLPHVQRSL